MHSPQLLQAASLLGSELLRARLQARRETMDRLLDLLRSETPPRLVRLIGEQGQGRSSLLLGLAERVATVPELESRWHVSWAPPVIGHDLEHMKDQDRGLLLLLDTDQAHQGGCVQALMKTTPAQGGRILVVQALNPPGDPIQGAHIDFRLKDLCPSVAHELLNTLDQEQGEQDPRALPRPAPRLTSLLDLLGTSPGTLCLLHRALALRPGAGAGELFLHVIEQQGVAQEMRWEQLPVQVQRLVAALARCAEPTNAARVARETGIDVNAVSSQFARLERSGLLTRVWDPESARYLFLLSDRGFQSWLLLRMGARTQLLELLEFLEHFHAFTLGEARTSIEPRIEIGSTLLRPAIHDQSLAFIDPGEARVLASSGGDPFDSELQELRRRVEDLFELSGLAPWGLQGMERRLHMAGLRERILQAQVDWAQRACPAEEFWALLGGSLCLAAEEKEWFVERIEAIPISMFQDLQTILEAERAISLAYFGPEGGEGIRRGLRSGWMTELGDIEGADALERATGIGGVAAIARARHLIERGLEPRILKDLERRLRASSSPFVWGLWAEILSERLGRHEDAERALMETLRLEPALPRYWRKLGRLQGLHLGRPEAAVASWRRALELDDRDAGLWQELAHHLARSLGRRQQAEEAWKRAIELDPGDAWSWTALANLEQEAGLTEKALESGRKAVTLDPTDAWSWNNLGCLLALPGPGLDRERSQHALLRSIELDPHDARPWCNLALLLLRDQNTRGDAERLLRRAATLDSHASRARALLALLLMETQEPAEPDVEARESTRILRETLTLGAADPLPCQALAFALAEQGGGSIEAETLWRQALSLDPGALDTARNLASYLANQGRVEEARALLGDALARADGPSQAWRELALLCDQPPRLPERRDRALVKAIERDPLEASLHAMHLAALVAQGADQASIELRARSLLELDPADSLAALRLAGALIERGEREQIPSILRSPLDRAAQRPWPLWGELLRFFQIAVQTGAQTLALSLLDPEEPRPALRLIRETLYAALHPMDDPLERVEPALREPVKVLARILNLTLSGDPLQSTAQEHPQKAPQKSARRGRRPRGPVERK